MRKNITTVRLGDFRGGEASIFPMSAFNPKFSVLLQNCYVSEYGNIAKMPGYSAVNTTGVSESLYTGHEYKKTDGTTETLTSGGGKIYKSGTTLTAIKTGLNTSAKVNFATMNDICIMVNGVNTPMKYDGTTVGNLGGTPPATAFKAHVHKNRVWLLERTNKMKASHSALNNPEDYTTSGDAGYIDFKYILREGDELLDVVTFVDLLVFFFRRHIAIYSGDTPSGTSADFRLVQLIEGSGVVDTNLIQGLGTDLVYVYDNGVQSLRQVVTTGNLNINDLSANIAPTLHTAMLSNNPVATAHFPKLSWYLVLIGSTVYVYSYTWKAWQRITGADINGMFQTSSGNLYFTGSGYLYLFNQTYGFNGVKPVMKWETGWYNLDKHGRKVYPKMVEMINFRGVNAVIKCEVRYDVETPQAEWYSEFATESNLVYIDDLTDFDARDPFDDDPTSQIRFPLYGGGRSIQFAFINESLLGPIEFNDMVVQVMIGGI